MNNGTRRAGAWIRPTWAEVDVDAFRHNLLAVAAHISPRAKVMAVLKADGYGHGATPLALSLIHI